MTEQRANELKNTIIEHDPLYDVMVTYEEGLKKHLITIICDSINLMSILNIINSTDIIGFLILPHNQYSFCIMIW